MHISTTTIGNVVDKYIKIFSQLNEESELGIYTDCAYSIIGVKTAITTTPRKAMSIYSLKFLSFFEYSYILIFKSLAFSGVSIFEISKNSYNHYD